MSRLVPAYSSIGTMCGTSISLAPAASISSRTIRSILSSTRFASGR
jgi:hypothetical protein